MSIDFHELGRRMGQTLASIFSDAARAHVRASFAARFGLCRVCELPLAGSSPEQICSGCHAAEVLAVIGGGPGAGDGGEA